MINDVRIEHFSDRIIPNLKHADVYYNSKLGEIRGSGSGNSLDRAIFIAFQEMRERYFFRQKINLDKNIKTSSGFASGLTADDAAKRAAFELIERDAFLRHWLCKRPPCWKKTPDKLNRHFSAYGFEVKTAFLGDYDKCQVALMAFRPLNPKIEFGFGIGTSAGISWEEQVDSLSFNISRLANIPLRRRELNLPQFTEFDTLKGPEDHYELYFNPKIAKNADWFWKSSNCPIKMNFPKIETAISECELDLPWKSYIAHATSDQVIHIQFGNNVNFDRFRTQLMTNELNTDPHPLG